MDQQNPTLAKILILDTGKFKQWKFRIQQYLQHEHYALWEVIECGDSYEAPQQESTTASASEGSVKKKERTVAFTTDDMQKRRNDVKARTTLLLALPDEHQLRFSKYKTAQELWAAILKTFSGNEATKKTKKNLLKQQYGNFKVEGSKTLEQTFNRPQAIVSHLEFMDIEIEPDDLNQKFLTSLAPEWLMHTIVWRNRSDLDTMILDDLYNHLKIKYKDINQIDEDDIKEMDIKWNMALLSIRADRFWKKTGKKISIQGTDVAGFDKSKVECFNYHKMGHFARECRAPSSQDKGRRDNYKQGSNVEEQAPKALMVIDGVGWDWSFMENKEENHALVADEEAPTEFALMAKSSSDNEVFNHSLCSKACKKNTDSLNSKITELSDKLSDTKTNLYHYKLGLAQVEVRLVEYKSQEIKFCKKIRAIEFELNNKNIKIKRLTNELENAKKEKDDLDSKLRGFQSASKDLDNLLESLLSSQEGYVLDKTLKLSTGNSKLSTADLGIKGKAHMTVNISYLSDYEPYDGGYVSFGQGGCKITSKGTIKTECIVLGRDFKLIDDTNVLLRTPRQHNMYSIDLNNIVSNKDLTCLVVKASADESELWHRRLGHLNIKTMNRLVRHNLVRGLPSKCFDNDHTCVACLKGKNHKASCKTKLVNSVTKPLHTLHMDLFDPTSISNLNHKWYCLVVTGDFSRFTWTFFLKTKDETSGILRSFITKIENLKDLKVKIIRCDNGGEFRNKEMNNLCSRKGIKREFSNARTPQQNRVAERRNKTLIEVARTMLADAKLSVIFWAKAVNTACYVQNRVLVNKFQNKTPYELFNGRTPAIGFLKPFGCHVMILNTLDHLGKFKAKGDKGYFIGYSMSSKEFRVFNKRTKRVEENLHVDFLENKAIEKGAGPNWLFDIDSLTNSMNYVPVVVVGINSTNFLGTKEATGQDMKKDVSSLRYIALLNWFHEAHLESSISNAQDACNADAPESSGNSNLTATSINPPTDHMETLAVETPIPTISSRVPTACLDDSPQLSSDTRLISKRVTSQDDTPSLDNILTLTNRFEDILRVTTNTDDSNGVEADLGNIEYNISASPTPTF
uniref:Putative ribonuclease H-like domain-containing protein n=1 Tax=Tanacetum cinerariifolium TaxID=118510 RepID=A0A6L2P0S5_TANCI|nr:putative ribonuclease H-like domain-containing protein [Tanacetum cinerariifolium]